MKARTLFTDLGTGDVSNPSLLHPHTAQNTTGIATHSVMTGSSKDHGGILWLFKAVLINKLLIYAVFQLSHTKAAVHCSEINNAY